MRACVFLLVATVIAVCAADKTSTFTGVLLAGQTSVAIPYGAPQPNHGLIINSNANASHSIMTTIEPRYAYSVWSTASKTWEASWTATWCELDQAMKQINIVIGCHSINSGDKCTSDVAYTLTVLEYNATLRGWNPDQGALRWQLTLGGLRTSAMWNVSLDDDKSKLLDSRSDLHFTIVTTDGSPSSAAAALYSFSSKDKNWETCNLAERKTEDKGGFAGTSTLFLGKTSISLDRQYVLVFNGTEPRQSYWLIAHVTPSLKRAVSIWIFIAIAVACLVVGAILTGICTSFFWHNGREVEREPLIRSP